MNTITVIIIYLSISGTFSIIIWILLYRNRKKNEDALKRDWILFETAVNKDDKQQIFELAERIVSNNTITTEVLEAVSNELEKHAPQHHEFLSLKEAIRLKKLIWNGGNRAKVMNIVN